MSGQYLCDIIPGMPISLQEGYNYHTGTFRAAFQGAFFDFKERSSIESDPSVRLLISGLRFLCMNSQSEYIREAAGTTIQAFEREEFVHLGMIKFRHNSIDSETPQSSPFRSIHRRFNGSGISIDIPSNFALLCTEQPLRTLSRLVRLASNVRDAVHGREAMEGLEKVELRAQAYEAHFIKELRKRGEDLPQYLKDSLRYFSHSVPITRGIHLINSKGEILPEFLYKGMFSMYYGQKSLFN